MICLHASGGTGAQWKVLADSMRHDFRVLTPDLHGHGTGPAWRGAPADIVAADAARVARMAAEAPGDVYLVGHSYGGAIALRVALYHPERVASVAVYEPVAFRALLDDDPNDHAAVEVAEVAGAIQAELDAGRADRAAWRFVDYWSGSGRWDRLVPELQAAIAHRMPVVNAHFVALAGDVARLWDYARLDVPVLCMVGRETRASTRRIAELLQARLPDVAAITVEAMGHLGPITHPDLVALRFAHFVRSGAATRNLRDSVAA